MTRKIETCLSTREHKQRSNPRPLYSQFTALPTELFDDRFRSAFFFLSNIDQAYRSAILVLILDKKKKKKKKNQIRHFYPALKKKER